MKLPSTEQVRSVAYEIVLAVVLEEVAAALGRRLRYGRRCPECGAPSPRRRPVRRLGGALLSELAAEGGDEMYWQRQRLMAAIDHKVAETQAVTHAASQPRIPQQRTAPQTVSARPAAD